MGPAWIAVRQMLDELSVGARPAGILPVRDGDVPLLAEAAAVRALSEASPAATSMRARRGSGRPTSLLDRLGLYTTEVFQRGREQVIIRQQQELMELSTPVVTLWDGVLALPLIGTLDSARTQVVMESLLQRIVESGAVDRDHRHHRRADRRYADGAASAEDGGGRAADGGRLHHQRHPAADRPDHRPSRRRSRGRRHQGDARRRLRDRAEAARPQPSPRTQTASAAARHATIVSRAPRTIGPSADRGTDPDSQDGRVPARHRSRWTCTTAWR